MSLSFLRLSCKGGFCACVLGGGRVWELVLGLVIQLSGGK